MQASQTYPVVEIFESLQGEGYNTGMEAVFLRFGGCNLACPWCDTGHGVFETLDGGQVVARVRAFPSKALILTGGEPFIQAGLDALLMRFKELGYWIGAETNGLAAPPQAWLDLIDYVAVSPKACFAPLYEDGRMLARADEVRIVVDGDVQAFCADMRRRIQAQRYFLTPCERDGVFNVAQTLRVLGLLNRGRCQGKWRLSFQAHKLAGMR